MAVRKLNSDEISQLQSQGCSCSDWALVEVSDCFSPTALRNVHLSGKVKLGSFQKEVSLSKSIIVPSGLSNCRIHNCVIEDDVYINNAGIIANYLIEKDVVIENVNSIIVEGETAFGNGTELDIVNEGGGRTLKIFDRLSANLAYFLVFYRHSKPLIKNLEALIDEYVAGKISSQGVIHQGASILNCRTITNVEIGVCAKLSGVSDLKEGTIVSCREDAVYVGNDVIAKNFIILSGARVDDGVILHGCFIGQGVKAGKQYSAENSAFFANSEIFHGEACSALGGPYTVTHHKSTLLIAGLYSFYNAGSGTNQSNHMYKLGPIHQGIVERGSKTGSFCYLLWPSRIGPFTTVLGKHYCNFDTSDLPFSYINEEEGKSYVTPAMNMFTVGTRRDSQKWPSRDRRKDPVKHDLINFELFSPYIVGKMVRASDELNSLYENTPKNKEVINYKGINLRRLLLKTSRKYYEMGIKIAIGNWVAKKLSALSEQTTWEEIKGWLKADTAHGLSRWVDIAGLLASEASVDKFVSDVELGIFKSIDEAYEALQAIKARYDTDEWNWCAALIEQRYKICFGDITPAVLKEILEDWKTNRIRLNNMIVQDAMKEFDPIAKIGFGIDGDSQVRDMDFEAIRGTVEENSFIKGLEKESREVEAIAEKLADDLLKYI